MTPRKKRLDKLIQHRVRELDKRISALAETRTHEREAEQIVAREREEHTRAEQERREALTRQLDAGSFMEANDFLVSCARKREVAEQKLSRARRAVEKAQSDVQDARNDLKKIELLTQRLANEERTRAARLEQKATDELVSLRQSDSAKRRSTP
ncbi:MAG TPA: flagellar export protein FliJ [Polyangiaceae bacterium]